MSALRPVRTLFAILVVAFALPAAGRGNTSHFIEKLSCDTGPYSLKLPKTYAELKRLAPLQSERLVRDQDFGTHRARHRELVFSGLRLEVVIYSHEPDSFHIAMAEIRNSSWKITGPFRFGQVLPAKVGDVETRALTGTGTIEFSGEEDTVRVRVVGRRVMGLTYLCVPD
jgi:hypothetical protein